MHSYKIKSGTESLCQGCIENGGEAVMLTHTSSLSDLYIGMMVFISLKELLPMAYKFDRTRSHIIIPIFLVLGMLIMAASLVLFLY